MEKEKNNSIKVLYAEDDPDDREFFADSLHTVKSDASLTLVEDGKELLAHLSESGTIPPDFIFIDINMPNINGKECLKKIRKNTRLKHVPVIILSTSSHPRDIEETFSYGANLYVKKPSDFKLHMKFLKKIFDLDWSELPLPPDKDKFVWNEHVLTV